MKPPSRAHEAAVREACARLHIGIYEQGAAVRISGPGVHILAASLRHVLLADLEPAVPRPIRRPTNNLTTQPGRTPYTLKAHNPMSTDTTIVPPDETPEEGHAMGMMFAQGFFDFMREGEAKPDSLYRMLALFGKEPPRLQGFCYAVQDAFRQLGAMCAAQATELQRTGAAVQKVLAMAERMQAAHDNPPKPIKAHKIAQFVYGADGEIEGAVLVTPGA